MSPENPRRVAIWRSALLLGSETFIRAQGDSLTRWSPTYVGATRIDSALARPDDVITFPDGNREFLRLRLSGTSPRLRTVLAGTGPELVHAHFGGDGWLVSRTAQQLKVPLIVTVHGHDVTRQPQSPGLHGVRYRRNLRSVFGRAALVVAVSEVIRDRAVRWGADPAKVRVHHIGVRVPDTVPMAPKRWDVVFVGRFVAKKGVDDLLHALARLDTPRPRALLIGDGPLLSRMRELAEELGVDATFVGSQPPESVQRHLAESRMLACPSKTAPDGDTEGLPTTVMEAGALGLPVVATRHSGIPEAVLDGRTGLLTPEGDPRALAASITRLLGDADLRRRVGTAARAHVAENFDLATQTGRLEDIYDEVTAGTPAVTSP